MGAREDVIAKMSSSVCPLAGEGDAGTAAEAAGGRGESSDRGGGENPPGGGGGAEERGNGGSTGKLCHRNYLCQLIYTIILLVDCPSPHLTSPLWHLFVVFTDRVLGRSLCEMS